MGQEGGRVDTRVLVAFEDDYRAYRDVIAAGIRVLRPHFEVEVSGVEALAEAIERFEPDVVICSRLCTVEDHLSPAWIELSVDPMRPARVRLAGRCWEQSNPTMETLLAVIDEFERISQW
jgi:hypothetical protein